MPFRFKAEWHFCLLSFRTKNCCHFEHREKSVSKCLRTNRFLSVSRRIEMALWNYPQSAYSDFIEILGPIETVSGRPLFIDAEIEIKP